MTWLRDLERETDFEEEAEEWKNKKTGRDLTTFISFFSKRDREVRRINKVQTAAGAGYHSAANVREEDLEARLLQSLEAKVETGMANLAEDMTEAIARAADGEGNSSGGDGGGATAYAATANDGTTNEVLALLKVLDTRIQKIESGRNSRKQRNRQSDDSDGKGDGGGGDGGGGAKCKHCDRVHPKTPEHKCWTLPENKGDVPEWFLRRLERKNKGK